MTRPSLVHRFFVPRIAAAIALLLVGWGCADKVLGPTAVEPKGQIGVFADLGPSGVTTLVIQVSGPGIVKADNSPDTLAFNIPLVDGVASGSLDVPAGPSRVITARAFVGVTETHRGSVTTNVFEGNNPTLQITLVPLVGTLPLTVSIGSTIVVVRPQFGSVAVGDTLRLTAEIRDHNGQVVNDHVRWATLNPLKASVDTLGLVTVRDTGDVQIVGTYGTVGGSATLSGVAVPSIAPIHLDWNGSVSNSWNVKENWTPHGLGVQRVPTLADSVVIPAAAPVMPVLPCLADTIAVRDIVVEVGAQINPSSCYPLNVYGSAVVNGPVPAINARPNAKLSGTFGSLYVRGAGATLVGNVTASFVQVDFPTAGTFSLGQHTLTTTGDFNVIDGTVTMVDGDMLIVGGNTFWSGDNQTGLLTGGVVIARGTSFYGDMYFGEGTNRVVLDRTATGRTQISGFDYINNPTNSQLRRLEIRSHDGADICGHVRVTDTLSFMSTGTPATLGTCSSYQVRVDGPLVTGASTDVANYEMDLRHPSGTTLVAGTWHPTITDFRVDDQGILPALAYNNVRIFARNTLPETMTINGYLSLSGTAAELDFGGHRLNVGDYAETLSGAMLEMTSPGDSLMIAQHLYMPNDSHLTQKAKLTAGVISIGAYLEGTGFASSGTKVVMTGSSTTTTNKYINSINYSSRPTQELYGLEIAPGATIGLCAQVRVRDSLIVRAGAHLNDWCGSPTIALQSELVTEATSTMDPGVVILNSAIGTSHVAGAFAPGETQFTVAGTVIKPGLGYRNVRIFAAEQLSGTTTFAGFLTMNGAAANLTVNGQQLTITNYLQLDNFSTLTMNNTADAVTVGEYATFNSDNSTAHAGKLTAGVLTIGERLEGTGFSASGTHKVVMAGTSSGTNKYINSLNFESRSAQGFQDLEIGAGKMYGLCSRVAVHGTLTVRTGATLQDWCSQPYLRLDGDLVAEETSNITPFNVILNSHFGTESVSGTFSPQTTTIQDSAAASHLKPELGYKDMQFLAPVALGTSLTVNGNFVVSGPASVLTLNGNQLTVTGNFSVQSNASLVMKNEVDVLDIGGNVSWNGGGSEAGKLTLGTTIFRGGDVCATNYETGASHTTVFDNPTAYIRFRCVNSSSTSQLLGNVRVQGMGVGLECHMNVSNQMEVLPNATVRQNCGSGTLYVGTQLQGDEGSSITNGASYPGSGSLSVVFGSASAMTSVDGGYDPHFTEFTALGSYIKPTSEGSGINYRNVRIDQSTAFEDSTEFEGSLEVINNAILDLGGNTVVVKGSMDLNNTAKVKMVLPTDLLIVGYGDPSADLSWDAGDNLNDGTATNPLLTNGAVKFYGDLFQGTQYHASLPGGVVTEGQSRHRFIFASTGSGNVLIQGNPQFANLEIRSQRPVVNNSSVSTVLDSLIMGPSTTFGGSNQLTVGGDIVTDVNSDLSVATINVDGPNGTSLVNGNFHPTTTNFRATNPTVGAVKAGLNYTDASFQNGLYHLSGATTFGRNVSVTANGQLVVNAKTMTVGGQLDVSASSPVTSGLIMNDSQDTVIVAGAVTFAGSANTSSLSAGAILTGGDYNMNTDVASTLSHTVVMTGSAIKTVRAFNGTARALQNLVIAGTGSVNLSSGVVVNGTLDIQSPVAVTGSSSGTTINGALFSVAGSSLTAGNLTLNNSGGTGSMNGTLNVTGTATFGVGSESIHGGAGYTYANMIVAGVDTVAGGPLNVTGALTVNASGVLSIPTGSTLRDVTVNGTVSFMGTSTSTGQLTVNSGGFAGATTDLTETAFVDFGRIVLQNNGLMHNGDRSDGGFRYRLSGSPNGFQNNTVGGGYNGVSGKQPFATLP